MAKFRFPRNPGTNRESPFEDARGDNPYSDGDAPPSKAIAENAFATPSDSEQRPYTPSDYEAILVPNAKGALFLAIVGLVPATIGVIGAGIAIASSGNWTTPLFYALPLQFAGMAAAVPACIIARRDLRAIKAGAMDDAGHGTSRLALWLGAFGVLAGAAPAVIYFAILIVVAVTG